MEERFWSKIEKRENGCWVWTGSLSPQGYGQLQSPGNQGLVLAHRFAFELIYGPVPEGLVLDHLCRNHACCNPLHLEAVTQKENVRRGNVTTEGR